MKLTKRNSIVILIIITLLVNINVVFNDYCLDDNYVTNGHAIVSKGFDGIKDVFTSRYYSDTNMSYGYRPIVHLSFIIEYEIFGFNPHLSHLINLILYLLICIIVLNLIYVVFANFDPLILLFITLIFSLHPLHTEVVASIKNRDELLSVLFSLIAIRLIIRYFNKKNVLTIILALPVYFIALLSKAIALVFIPIAFLIIFYVHKISMKNFFLIFTFFIILFILYRVVLKEFVAEDTSRDIHFFENPLKGVGILPRIYTALVILLYYLKLMITPFPLICYYGFDMLQVRTSPDYFVIISAIFHLGILIIAITGLKRKKWYSFAILIYLLSLSIYMNIPKLIPGMLAERFTFFAVLGFSIFAGKLFIKLVNTIAKKETLRFIILIMLLLPFSVMTFSRNLKWKNHITLFENDIKYGSRSVKLNDLLATEHLSLMLKSKKYDDAMSHLQKANKYYKQCLKIYPESAIHFNDLGMLQFLYYHNYDSAVYYLKKTLKLEPENNNAKFNLSQSYLLLKDTTNALKYLKSILETDSLHFKALSSWTNLNIIMKDTNDAIYGLKILKNNYTDNEITNILNGNYYIMLKDTNMAIQYFEKAMTINPKDLNTIKVLMTLYALTGNKEKANYYKTILQKLQKLSN
ncbi:MAG: hypothetical protein Kow0068_03410 [Marinilabiliales bacterium]